jgi:hypothetical protein
MYQHRRPNFEGPLVAAARTVARHPEYAVRVVLPHRSDPITEAVAAAELAGVDFVLARTTECPTVHFVARHPDRRVTRRELGATFRSVRVRNRRPEPRSSAPRPVDVAAFRRASQELALNTEQDPQVQRIWDRVLRSRASAHLCGGIPTLVVNDIGGLVGILRRRARVLGVTLHGQP